MFDSPLALKERNPPTACSIIKVLPVRKDVVLWSVAGIAHMHNANHSTGKKNVFATQINQIEREGEDNVKNIIIN